MRPQPGGDVVGFGLDPAERGLGRVIPPRSLVPVRRDAGLVEGGEHVLDRLSRAGLTAWTAWRTDIRPR
jgi:hypothetical protein